MAACNFFLKRKSSDEQTRGEEKRARRRQQPVLQRRDPTLRTADKVRSLESPFTWGFFDSSEGFMIDEDLIGRVGPHPTMNVNFFWFGRKNRAGAVTVIKYSQHEGKLMAKFLSGILDQIELYPTTLGLRDDLIPLLKGKPGDAYDVPDDHYKESFWTKSQVILQSVRARLVYNQVYGNYMLWMNSPVNDDLCVKYKGWVGAVTGLTLAGMRNMEAFLLQNGVEGELEPDSQPIAVFPNASDE